MRYKSSNNNSISQWRPSQPSNKLENSEPDENKKPQSQNHTLPKGKETCHFWKQPGHLSRECPKRRNRINNVGMNPEGEASSRERWLGWIRSREWSQKWLEFTHDSSHGEWWHLRPIAWFWTMCYRMWTLWRSVYCWNTSWVPSTTNLVIKMPSFSHRRCWLMRCKPDKGKATLIAFLIGGSGLYVVIEI